MPSGDFNNSFKYYGQMFCYPSKYIFFFTETLTPLISAYKRAVWTFFICIGPTRTVGGYKLFKKVSVKWCARLLEQEKL